MRRQSKTDLALAFGYDPSRLGVKLVGGSSGPPAQTHEPVWLPLFDSWAQIISWLFHLGYPRSQCLAKRSQPCKYGVIWRQGP
jgi:hypothetical protein